MWPGSSKSTCPHPEPPTFGLSPSSRISSYFRTATWRLQAFWMVRAKPSNLRSRISSRRKSWARGRGGGSFSSPSPPTYFCLPAPAHMLTYYGKYFFFFPMTRPRVPSQHGAQAPALWAGLAGFRSQLCLFLAVSCLKWCNITVSHTANQVMACHPCEVHPDFRDVRNVNQCAS